MKVEHEKEPNSNRMATYVRAMYIVNDTETKEVMLKINYVRPGPAYERQDEILPDYDPPTVARLGSVGGMLRLTNPLPQVGKDGITSKQCAQQNLQMTML